MKSTSTSCITILAAIAAAIVENVEAGNNKTLEPSVGVIRPGQPTLSPSASPATPSPTTPFPTPTVETIEPTAAPTPQITRRLSPAPFSPAPFSNAPLTPFPTEPTEPGETANPTTPNPVENPEPTPNPTPGSTVIQGGKSSKSLMGKGSKKSKSGKSDSTSGENGTSSGKSGKGNEAMAGFYNPVFMIVLEEDASMSMHLSLSFTLMEDDSMSYKASVVDTHVEKSMFGRRKGLRSRGE